MLKRVPRAWLEMGKVFSGLFARNVLRGLFKLLVAAFVTPAAMGVLRATVSLFRILTSLSEFGINHAVTVFVPAAIRNKDEREHDQILTTTAVMLGGIICGVLIVGQLTAGWLAEVALSDPSLVVYVRLAVLAVGGRLIWRFVSSNLSAHQQFGRLALYLTTIPVVMLATALVLAVLGRLDLTAAIAITLFAPTAAVVLWWPALDRSYLHRENWSILVARRILRFSRWVYLSNIASSLRSHLNPLLLKSPRLSGSVAGGEVSAGLYGFGNDLANELQMLSGAIVTVLVPKAASRSGDAELRRYFKRAYRGILLLLIPLTPLFLLADPALRLLSLLSRNYLEYLPSLEVFTILYIGGLFSVATIPAQTVIYALRRPQIETRVEAAMLPILIVGGILLIPRFGPNGAALTILVQRVLTFLVLVGYAVLRLWRWSDDAPAQSPPSD